MYNSFYRGFTLIFGLLLFLATSETAFSQEARRIVRVGIFQNKPVVFLDEQGNAAGLYADILDEIARLENWDLRYVSGSFSNIVQFLNSREIDIISSIAQTEPRKRVFDFSKQTVWTLWGTIYIRPNSDVQTVLDLESKKIAAMKRGVLGTQVKALCASFEVDCLFKETNSQKESLDSLLAGDVEAAVLNNTFAISHINLSEELKKSPIIFSPLKASFAVLKGENTDLLKTIDSHLKTWKRKKSSVFYRSQRRWMGQVEVEKLTIPNWLLVSLGSTLLGLLIMILWTVMLRRQVRLRTNDLISSNDALKVESEQRKLAQESLQKAHDQLEEKVRLRTNDLVTINEQLNQEIVERLQVEERLNASLKEKEVLLHEVHHRVKNNLAVISSLLGLQTMSLSDPKLKEAFEDSQNRIQSMSAIHETLYHSDDLSTIDLNVYLSKLATTVAKSYESSNKVDLVIIADSVALDAQKAAPIGLILNELITNSYKYAFPNDSEGNITITANKKEGGVELIYEDDGIGFSKDFSLEDSKSLGLTLVNMLAVNQLDGTIDFNSNPGVKFTITFDLE